MKSQFSLAMKILRMAVGQPVYAGGLVRKKIRLARRFRWIRRNEDRDGRVPPPLVYKLVLTYTCNLRCQGCFQWGAVGWCRSETTEAMARELDWEIVQRLLAEVGPSRPDFILTGGEPLVYSRFEDLAALLKHHRCQTTICTNGTLPLESSADYLWVSLDGSPHVHDGVRGEGFERVWRNIQRSAHPRIYVNYTASRLNAHSLEQAFDHMAASPAIRGVMFHLFTPVVGSDRGLALRGEQRRAMVRRLLRLKRRHPLQVTNTYDGLRALRDDTWERPVWSAVVINQGQLTSCCCRDGIFDAQTCALCSCTPAMETWVLQRLRPLALLENLRFL